MKLVLGLVGLTIHLAVIARALLVEDREPQARAAWLLLLLAAPGVGAILYVLFGEPWVSARFRRTAADAKAAVAGYAPPGDPPIGDPTTTNVFAAFAAANGWTAVGGNRAEVAPSSEAAIDFLVADIDAATRSVQLSFYIWLADHNGAKVADAICRAATRGVTCRIVADAIGSRAFIRSRHWAAMRQAGARLCASLAVPWGLWLLAGHRVDLRNHRKIALIDGQIAYCGSQNLADAAFLPKRRFAPWVDILVRYEGPVARQSELIFAALWTTETGEDLRAFATQPAPEPRPGGFVAIATDAGPLSPRGTMTDLFAACLAAASESVTITTPYFAPDPRLLGALLATARRGVGVRIVFPHRNDSFVVGVISRAYYPVLAAAGVRIFEFQGGLLHAKTLVVDETLTLVGSANMDRRSLDLNFENNVLFASRDLAAQVTAMQDRWVTNAVEVDHGRLAHRSLLRRLADNTLTILGALF